MLEYTIMNNITNKIILITNDQTVFHFWLKSNYDRLEKDFKNWQESETLNPLKVNLDRLTNMKAYRTALDAVNELDIKKRVENIKETLSCNILMFDVTIETVEYKPTTK